MMIMIFIECMVHEQSNRLGTCEMGLEFILGVCVFMHDKVDPTPLLQGLAPTL